MSEYIDRDAAIRALCECCLANGKCGHTCKEITNIESIPAADVRPVVTCGNCVYAYPYGLEIKCTKHSGRAERFGEDASYSEFHDLSWFCADAQERRKNEKD